MIHKMVGEGFITYTQYFFREMVGKDFEVSGIKMLTIKERMASGRDQYIARCKEQGIKMGRPSSYRKSDEIYKEQYPKEISLLRKGISLRNIYAITGTSVGTLRKLKAYL